MAANDLPLLAQPKISDEVYKVLKEKIFSKQFVPGERLNLLELEKRLGISRTPLKDALNRLAGEGLIVIEPRRGTFVTNPTCREIAESFDVRRVLEVYAVSLAANNMTKGDLDRIRSIVRNLGELVKTGNWQKIYQKYVLLDRDLHQLILEIAGNERLKEIWDQINTHVQMSRIRYGRTESELAQAQQEHEQFLKACEAGDLAAMQKAISDHIDRAKRSLLQELEQHGA